MRKRARLEPNAQPLATHDSPTTNHKKIHDGKKARAEQLPPIDHQLKDVNAPCDVIEWMLGISKEDFFREYFERRPYVIHRPHNTLYFADRIDWSTDLMKQLIKEKVLRYSTDANVVRYDKVQKKRVPYKTDGKIELSEVVRCMEQGGWSCRFLRPHEHSVKCSKLIKEMEAVFSASCGANSYWTPKGSQGFAPHYDDVDVFLLQLEGEKHWRLYPPPSDVDVLSRHSSEDYDQSELPPKPTMSILLKAGDALYMPRGWVHQGHTDDTVTHSLHITFSANQMHAWADMLQRMVTHQIEVFAANDVEWRRAVPRQWMDSLGSLNNRRIRSEELDMNDRGPSSSTYQADADPLAPCSAGPCSLIPADRSQHRARLLKRIRDFIGQLATALNDAEQIDHCADIYAQDCIARMQPGDFSSKGIKSSTTSGHKDNDDDSSLQKLICVTSALCSVRLLLSVPGEAVVVYAAKNSRICGEHGVQKLRFERDFAPAIASILDAFPNSVAVSSLPMPGFEEEDAIENRQVLAEALVDSGAFQFL